MFLLTPFVSSEYNGSDRLHPLIFRNLAAWLSRELAGSVLSHFFEVFHLCFVTLRRLLSFSQRLLDGLWSTAAPSKACTRLNLSGNLAVPIHAFHAKFFDFGKFFTTFLKPSKASASNAPSTACIMRSPYAGRDVPLHAFQTKIFDVLFEFIFLLGCVFNVVRKIFTLFTFFCRRLTV